MLWDFFRLLHLVSGSRDILLKQNAHCVFIPALAQAGGPYVDPDNGITFFGLEDPVHSITYGFTFPPLASNSSEFIGEIVAPFSTTAWAGVSPGGAMVNNLLLVAWPNAGSIVSSARFATCV